MLASLLRSIAAGVRLQIGTLHFGRPRDASLLASVPGLVQTGRHREAERLLLRRLKQSPADAHALHCLGLVYLATGRIADAITHIRRAVESEPHVLFHSNLGEAYRAAGRLQEAESHARKAIALDPGDAQLSLKLAQLLAQRHRPAEALALTTAFLEREPEALDALLFAAALHMALHRPAGAVRWFQQAAALSPGHPAALIGLHRARRWLCDWSSDPGELPALLEQWARKPADEAFAGLNPFVAYEVDVAQEVRDAVTQSHADRLLRKASPGPFAFEEGRSEIGSDRAGSGRIRVGYLSSDYHNHPTMHLMRGLFARHDSSRFEIFAYSLGPDDGSTFRRELIEQVHCFRDLQRLTPAEAAAAIRADGVGILVDLKGYTHGACPEILAMKPAPLRVAWLGYPASTGCGINDYVIADPIVLPQAAARHFGECPVYLPHSYQVNDDGQPIGPAPGRTQLGLPPTGIVYACFNHVYKIDPAIFSVWMRILQRTEGSVLWLYSDDIEARANLEAQARQRGIAPSRLVFAGTLPKAQHLARLGLADLFLDTLPINAHTGASDALWAGLPVLTCPREAFPSRVAASVVCAAGLPALVCSDLAEYEEKAVQLALHPKKLRDMRLHLETEHARLPLFDTARFVRNLERAYENMWQRWLAGEAPRSFAVEEPPAKGKV